MSAARLPVSLKDGDLIRLGSDTLARAEVTTACLQAFNSNFCSSSLWNSVLTRHVLLQIVPIPSDEITVEQYLQAECCRLVQQLKVISSSSEKNAWWCLADCSFDQPPLPHRAQQSFMQVSSANSGARNAAAL